MIESRAVENAGFSSELFSLSAAESALQSESATRIESLRASSRESGPVFFFTKVFEENGDSVASLTALRRATVWALDIPITRKSSAAAISMYLIFFK